VLNAAKQAGATCFISTSSGSVSIRRARYWIAPWERTPKHFVQVVSDATEPPKQHDHFFGNYPVTKLEAEHIVRAADDLASSFRTGCIRPANGIYGIGDEASTSISGMYLRLGGAPTYVLCKILPEHRRTHPFTAGSPRQFKTSSTPKMYPSPIFSTSNA
jgi:nucleoside-diphosphate-sugar epimerase